MNASLDFATFLTQFFELFVGKSFRSSDYLEYLTRTDSQRSGDEASVVDTAIVGPLLVCWGSHLRNASITLHVSMDDLISRRRMRY